MHGSQHLLMKLTKAVICGLFARRRLTRLRKAATEISQLHLSDVETSRTSSGCVTDRLACCASLTGSRRSVPSVNSSASAPTQQADCFWVQFGLRAAHSAVKPTSDCLVYSASEMSQILIKPTGNQKTTICIPE